MRIACSIAKATNTQLFHCNIVCTNASQCYVIRTLPVLFMIMLQWESTDRYTARQKCSGLVFSILEAESFMATLRANCWHVMKRCGSMNKYCSKTRKLPTVLKSHFCLPLWALRKSMRVHYYCLQKLKISTRVSGGVLSVADSGDMWVCLRYSYLELYVAE
jgi:hypothetical protein